MTLRTWHERSKGKHLCYSIEYDSSGYTISRGGKVLKRCRPDMVKVADVQRVKLCHKLAVTDIENLSGLAHE